MHTDLYYFTGTGNSLAVARELAERIDGTLHAIPALMDRERIRLEAGAVGLVFPVYHKGIPLILKRFVEKLEIPASTYLFSVYTHGDTPGLAVRQVARLIRARGGELAAGFEVNMPYNYLTPSPVIKGFYRAFKLREIPIERQQALFAAAPAKIDSIADFVTDRKSGTFEITSDILTRLAFGIGLEENLGKAVWLKVAGVEGGGKDLAFIESRQLMDHGFHADARCNGCGVCARVCPVGNIRMVEGDGAEPHPTWLHRCEQCFACLHWCPQAALQFGENTAGTPRYHHPKVKLADMVRARAQT